MVNYRKYSGPLVPGTKSVKAKGGRKYLKRRSYGSSFTPSLRRQMKQISLAQSETKIASQNANSIDLYHNVTHYVKNILATIQGVTSNPGTTEIYNRIGNEVIARGVKVRLQFISDPTHPNMNIKYWIFRYETSLVLDDALFYVGPQGAGANQNRMIDFPDTRNIKVLKSGLIQNRNKLLPDKDQNVNNAYRDCWIPLNDYKLKYNGNDSSEPKFTTLGMAFLCYDANNTLQTDILNYLSYTVRFYFKDP